MSSQRFEATPESVARVRRFVAESLSTVADQVVDDIVLMASELATNAVRHAGTTYTVAVDDMDGEINVVVTDHGGGLPVRKSPTQAEFTGRGILIVDTLSNEWGVETSPHATRVWFRVRREPAGYDSRA